jgi:hypothetical protein
MLSKIEIQKSIDALRPAPKGESIQQCGYRVARWLLSAVQDEHPAIKETVVLYDRLISGFAPSPAEWKSNCNDLDLALARARDLARALALARARTLDLALARARALARALDLARARALARALDLARARDLDLDLDRGAIKILGGRLRATQRLDAQILKRIDAGGDLDMGTWHWCETTHCRAGWAITINPAGAELERVFGSGWAGRLIYLKSTGKVPNFFASDAAALADIKRCAAVQP